jgi:hypothetical protein
VGFKLTTLVVIFLPVRISNGFFMRLACKLGKSHNFLFFSPFLADDENSTPEPTAKLKSYEGSIKITN